MEKNSKNLSVYLCPSDFGAPCTLDKYNITHWGAFVNTDFEIWECSLFCTILMQKLRHFCAF